MENITVILDRRGKIKKAYNTRRESDYRALAKYLASHKTDIIDDTTIKGKGIYVRR